MSKHSYQEIKEQVSKRVSERRFQHTLSVKETAIEIFKSLANSLNTDEQKQIINHKGFEDKLRLAAILHDSCKELKNDEQLQLADFYKIKIYPEDKDCPNLLHARVAAKWVEDEYEIVDPYILKAIEEHTLGGVEMLLSSKILFLADMTEPMRKSSDDLEKLRELIHIKKDLDQALIFAMDRKINYVMQKSQKIHPLAIEARNNLI